MGIWQPGMHRCQANLGAIAYKKEAESQLGHTGVNIIHMLSQIQPIQRIVIAYTGQLDIINQNSSQQSQANTYGTYHNIFPGCLQRGAGKLKGHQQGRYQGSCLNGYPHQTQIIDNNYP